MNMRMQLFLSCSTIFFLCPNSSHADPISGINVRPVDEREFSFIVSIRIRDDGKLSHWCTGALISRNHVLTASHCLLDNIPVDRFEILVGSSDLRDCKTYYAKSWISYEKWEEARNNKVDKGLHDIGIMKLKTSVTESHVKVASFSGKKNDELYGLRVEVAGWGAAEGRDESSQMIMQTVTVNVITNQDCETRFQLVTGEKGLLSPTSICTIAKPAALLTCSDSGGPLFYKKNKIIGINKGLCPKGYDPSHTMNIHVGTYPYRKFIDHVKKNDL